MPSSGTHADFQDSLVGGAGGGGQARTSGTTSSGRFDDGWHGCMFDCTEQTPEKIEERKSREKGADGR